MTGAGTSAAAEARDKAWGALMKAAQDGDTRAYEAVLSACEPFIRAVAGRRCRDRALLEDVVQETLLTVHRVRMTYDPRRSFQAWLSAIADRRAIDALRKRGRIALRETHDEEAFETFADPAAKDLDEPDAGLVIAALMEGLPERQREALELVKVKEMSLKEAAQASGQTPGALKVNVHRAIKALRARLTGGGS